MTGTCPREQCTGCAACANVCPQKCICMVPDVEGFLFPKVDPDSCVDCGLCQDVCPIIHVGGIEHLVPRKVYACWNNDEATRFDSSSGGAFSALAKHVLDQGGVVFGAAFDKDMTVKHIPATTGEELGRLRGSKYVQSDIGFAYLEVGTLLQQGRRVLFSGTPCQIAGLHAALGKKHENLITCDLLCHGVPSPGLFVKYARYLERCFRAKLINIDFRSKCVGWEVPSTIAFFNNGKQHVLRDRYDSFMHGFVHNLTMRRSCYRCPYAKPERQGDITLGDFWGIGEFAPFRHDTRNGISVVLVNSKEGCRLLEESAPQLCLEERKMEEVRSMRALSCPWPEPKNRDGFFSNYQQVGYDKLAKTYLVDKGLKRLIKLVVPPAWIFFLRKRMKN